MTFSIPYPFKLLSICALVLTFTNAPTGAASSSGKKEVTVEVAVVCDPEFSEFYNHDKDQILDYLTILFWDVTMGMRTLTKTIVNFRVTSVTIMDSQENSFMPSRKNGSSVIDAELAYENFTKWIFRKLSQLPKFDFALAVSNKNGLAKLQSPIKTACLKDRDRFYGVGIAGDSGYGPNSNSLDAIFSFVSMLGALSDDQADCKDRGYLMDWGDIIYGRHFLSTCSDKQIHDYVSSAFPNCLKELNQIETQPVLDPDFDDMLAPLSVEEQCKIRLNISDAFVKAEDQNKCSSVSCWETMGILDLKFTPFDNTKCGSKGQRCFRGTCLKPGSILVNAETEKCLQSGSRFTQTDFAVLSDCPRSPTPTEGFVLMNAGTTDHSDTLLTLPFMSIGEKKVSQKCLGTRGIHGGDFLEFKQCKSSTAMLWHLIDAGDVGDGEFLLKHRASKKCVKHFKGNVLLDKQCNKNDKSFRWKFHLVHPLPGMCGEDEICEPELKVEKPRLKILSHKKSGNHKFALDIDLLNEGEPAIAPAVTIHWNNDALRLSALPSKCILMHHHESEGTISYKCKLGRLLMPNEKAPLVTLEFEGSPSTLKSQIIFNLRPSSAPRATGPDFTFQLQSKAILDNHERFEL